MRKRASIVLFAFAVLLGTVGTGAFSTTEAERGVNVTVVDDEEAYVGYDPVEVNATDGETVALVTVANRFHIPIDVTEVTVTEPPDGNLSVNVSSLEQPAAIGTGEADDVVGTIECDGPVDEAPIGVTVTVNGTGVSATLFGESEHRTVTVSCRS